MERPCFIVGDRISDVFACELLRATRFLAYRATSGEIGPSNLLKDSFDQDEELWS